MSEESTLTLDRITAPSWDNDPVGWLCWLLETHPEIYREFRRLADDRLEVRPGDVLSSDQLLHVIRHNTALRAQGDTFKINDHASAPFARLYMIEYPEREGCFRTRNSFFDMLNKAEEERLLLAFEPLRVNRRRFV